MERFIQKYDQKVMGISTGLGCGRIFRQTNFFVVS